MKNFTINLKNFLVNLNILRFILIPVLKKVNFEFRWKHDLTNRPFYLQSYYHKGYWFYGKNREKDVLDLFQKNYKRRYCTLGWYSHWLFDTILRVSSWS